MRNFFATREFCGASRRDSRCRIRSEWLILEKDSVSEFPLTTAAVPEL
jgi:hypothetical protein